MKFILLLVAVLPFSAHSVPTAHPLSEEFIASINAKQTTWKAGRNFPEGTSLKELNQLAGTLPEIKPRNARVKVHDAVLNLPENFDGRDYWPQCQSLHNIRNQESCGSCWAFGIVEAITDRVCIASNGTTNFKFSAEDVVTCCTTCGSCKGGYEERALKFWLETGIVSGGDYNSNQGCQPYTNQTRHGNTATCSTTCKNTNYSVPYNKDKHYGESYYYLPKKDVEQIQIEVFKNGPVTTVYDVYNDFFSYKSGVYQHTTGDKAGGHAVKIIGWGMENGVPYWLAANSWGSKWGDGGFFKILRGENHCGFEQRVCAGFPKL